MDIGGYLSMGMKRMGGGDWTSAHCVEKIQEMLSRAIRDQEDLLKILISSAQNSYHQPPPTDQTATPTTHGPDHHQQQQQQHLQEAAAGNSSNSNNNRQQQLVSGIECIPGKILRPLTAKLENSLDWCHLALCRIKEFTAQSDHDPAATPITSSMTAGAISQQAMAIPRYPKLEVHSCSLDGPHNNIHVQQPHDYHHPCSTLKLQHRPAALHSLSRSIPERSASTVAVQDSMSSLALQDGAAAGSDSAPGGRPFPARTNNNPVTYSFRESRKNSTSLIDPSGDHLAGLAADQSTLSMLASDLDPCSTQGQNFEGQLHTAAPAAGGMDENHPYGQAADHHEHEANASAAMECSHTAADIIQMNKEQLTASVASKGLPHSSSSNHLTTMDRPTATASDHQFFQQSNSHDDDSAGAGGKTSRGPNVNLQQQVNHDRLMPTSRRNPIRVKREREAASGEEAEKVVEVVYQRLRPGIDVRKGIPEDGHKGWKKYGNKNIQNAIFCRGYYKCSAKECNAKKMVQPTDEDPSVFEVTYMGSHTCSSSNYPHKKQHRIAAARHTVPAAGAAVTHDAAAAATQQESRNTLDDNHHHHQSPKRNITTATARDQLAASSAAARKERKKSTGAMSVKDEVSAPAAAAATTDHQEEAMDVIGEEKAALDHLHLQANFSTWSTEVAAAGAAAAITTTADHLTSSDLDSQLADQEAAAASSNNSSCRSDHQDAATTTTATTTTTIAHADHHQDQSCQSFPSLHHDHEQEEEEDEELQQQACHEASNHHITHHATAPAAHHHHDLQHGMQEMMMNGAGDLGNSLEGFDIHQQLHDHHHDHHHDDDEHHEHHHHYHDQVALHNAQAFLSFHESMFDSWADLCMDTSSASFPTLANTLECSFHDHINIPD